MEDNNQYKWWKKLSMERFENRLNKNKIKFNVLNPVWDNEKEDALNVFEMIECLNDIHEENIKMKQKGLNILQFYIQKLKNANQEDIQSVREELWIVKEVLYEIGLLEE